jgi:hypothetical protein
VIGNQNAQQKNRNLLMFYEKPCQKFFVLEDFS